MPAQKAGSIEGASRLAAAASAWGPYVLGRRIGRGAMGVVYAALHRNAAGIARLVAVKILVADRADHPEERAAFLREARILARLDHPNVVRWLDAGEIDGDVFIAMELLHGASLAEIVAASAERLPLPIAIAVLADLARGLHAAHELRDEGGQPLGLVHQDISPQNVVVGYDGRARLVDFGIARLASVDASRTDTVRGKPAYLAPEQLEGRRLDRRTDVFALGVVAFEILAGRRLFARASIAETHTAVLFEPIPDLCDVRPDLPPDLAAVVSCALSRSPSGRFHSAEAFRRALLGARDDAKIPPADEAEIAALVAARVRPAWRPHDLFAEIDAAATPRNDRAPADAAEISEVATVAPKREREAPKLSEAATVAPKREREAPEPSDAATVAPRRNRGDAESSEAAAMVGIPSNDAAPMVGIPSNVAAPIVGIPSNVAAPIVGIPSNVAAPIAAPPGSAPLAAVSESESLPPIPVSVVPAWLRGALIAVGGVAILVVVIGVTIALRRAVRVPTAAGAPTASVAAAEDAPRKRTEEPAPDAPVASSAPSGSASIKGLPARASGLVPTSAAVGPSSATSVATAAPVLPATASAQAAVEPPANGWISVWSTPWGRVRVDGRDVGDSPAVRIPAPPGPHTVSVKTEAGEQARGVTVKGGEEAKVRFVF